jgi:hypothetical protein
VDLITAIGKDQARRRARFATRWRSEPSDVTETIARNQTTTPTASRSGAVPYATSKPNAGDGARDDDSD